ncbi:ABC transporter substrate-binding protein [Gemmatimonas aurantiaca]|nr:ABC transporter substrate-binding protein [Gemmatimonas aurantiaca]
MHAPKTHSRPSQQALRQPGKTRTNLSLLGAFFSLSSLLVHLALTLPVLFILVSPSDVSARGKRVTVVRVTQDKSSDRLIRGIKAQFRQSGVVVKLQIISTAGMANVRQSLPDSLRRIAPDAIITVGSGVTNLVADSITDIPIIFSGVFYPELSGFVDSRIVPGGNVTGASLDISPDVQFKYFKQVNPNLDKLGVIYSSETAKLIPHAKVVAKARGIELIAVEVGKSGSGYERDIYRALDSLLAQVDGLWSLADGNVFSKVGTNLIIKRTLVKKAPFMGFSATIVASGALFALDIDYKDVGRQTAELVERTLAGEAVSHISITAPRMIWFHYNENTASRVAANIPEELRVVAKEVHQ